MGKTTNKKDVELNIIYRNIKELKPYKKNAKKHPKEQVERIMNSIKEFGFTQPVVIDTNNCVVAGHGRILGAKKAGLKQVPTVMLEDLTEEQIKAYRLVDNKLNESDWDFGLLDEELGILSEDIDMELFGFDLTEQENDEEKKKKVEFEVKKENKIIITCKTKRQTEDLYKRLIEEGYSCTKRISE